MNVPMYIHIPNTSTHGSTSSVSLEMAMDAPPPPPSLERWSSQGSTSDSKIPPALPKRFPDCDRGVTTTGKKVSRRKSDSSLPPKKPQRSSYYAVVDAAAEDCYLPVTKVTATRTTPSSSAQRIFVVPRLPRRRSNTCEIIRSSKSSLI